jgi:hypothetical protein
METRINAGQNQRVGRAAHPTFPATPRLIQAPRDCRNFALAVLVGAIVALTILPGTQATAATLTVSTKTLPAGYVSSAYSQALAATGGSGTGYSWSVTSGALPNGIALVATSGLLHGTPTAVSSATLTFKVKDSAGNTASATLALGIHAALAVKSITMPEAYVGSPYSLTFAAIGGSGTGLSWSISSGSLPSGLALSTSGKITGQATGTGSTKFSVEVKDSAENIAKASFTLWVGPQLVITTARPLPIGYVGTQYSFGFGARGGSGKGYVWTTTSNLKQVFFLTTAGVLYGTASAPETFAVTVVVTDSAKNTASAEYTLIINPAVAQCTNDNQDSALSELHGVYTFTLERRNLTTGNLFHSIGSFDADGPGTISNGVMDSNGPEFTAATENTFTGTYTIGSDGRGRMNIAIPITGTGPQTRNLSFCFALDSFSSVTVKGKTTYGASNHAFVIEDDTSNVTSSGEFLAQVVNPTDSIMQGSWAFGMTGNAHYPTLIPNGPDPRFAFAGYVDMDGSGKVTGGELDEVISDATDGKLVTPTYRPETSLIGTYSIPTPSSGLPTGRGTMSVSHDGVVFAQFVFYPYGGATNTITGPESFAAGMVFLETNVPVSGSTPVYISWAGTGARRTAATFSTASLDGWSVTSQHFVENPGMSDESEGVEIDLDHWDGAGNFTYTGDQNAASVATTVSGKGTYTVDANGRFAVMVNGLCSPCGYLTGPNQGFAIYDNENTGLSFLEQQTLSTPPFAISTLLGGFAFGTRWYLFPQQQTASGETVTEGLGSFTGTVDTNTLGKADVDINLTALETATATSDASGRFLYQPSNATYPYAIYIIDRMNAVAIPLGGSGGETDPLLRFIHQ